MLKDIAVVPFFHSQVTVIICYHPDDDVCCLWWDVINPASDSLVMTIQAQGPSDGLKNMLWTSLSHRGFMTPIPQEILIWVTVSLRHKIDTS